MADDALFPDPVPYADAVAYARSAGTLLLIAAVVAAIPFAAAFHDLTSARPDPYSGYFALITGAIFFGTGVSGYGLRRARPWSRVPGAISAIVILPVAPVGTFLGIRTLVYLHSAAKGGVFATPIQAASKDINRSHPPAIGPT